MIFEQSHRIFNPFTGEWILVSPHRIQRLWQGKFEQNSNIKNPEYLDDCYLCRGNIRASNDTNPNYTSTFVFNNDFSTLKKDVNDYSINESELLKAKSEKGIYRVVCFSPKHNITLAELEPDEIVKVINTWREEYTSLGDNPFINYVQIFENKGEIMGCSNPHPHGQIWAQENIPGEPTKEQVNQLKHIKEKNKTLLDDYLRLETDMQERVVYENESFILIVPFWAVWPFETIIISKRAVNNILQLNEREVEQFADVLKITTVKYDNIFKTSFPYSAGIHQAPTDGLEHPEWYFHMHFYPQLLRSSTIKKFLVGYEMLSEPQRDITPEMSAQILKQSDVIHYSLKMLYEKK